MDCKYRYIKLESETSGLSTEDTESVKSFQGVETDFVRDSSDTEDGSEYDIEIEYEVESASGSDLVSPGDTSGGSDLEREMFMAAAVAICDSSFDRWVTDGEDSDLSSSGENSFNRTDFWTCVKCKSKKNNPLYSYCEKCFQDRKTLYPPRPKRRKPRKNKNNPPPPVALDHLRSCLKGLSQDSSIGSSQECPPLGLDQIVIPPHLMGDHSEISSSRVPVGNPTAQQIPDEIDIPSTSKNITLNDIVRGNATRKRQLSESSLSDTDVDVKRPRWRSVKKSPRRDASPIGLTNRKRKSTSCEPISKKVKLIQEPASLPTTQSEDESLELQKISVGSKSASQESIDIFGKTSDLGSEISSGSGIFDKAEELNTAPVVENKDICIFCHSNPINAGFLHGNIAHRCSCYTCAKRTWKTIKRCPMCNRRVSNIIKVY